MATTVVLAEPDVQKLSKMIQQAKISGSLYLRGADLLHGDRALHIVDQIVTNGYYNLNFIFIITVS
jgi:hypothetical protein